MAETLPPTPIGEQGHMVAPVKCVVCREVAESIHEIVWAPRLPPSADGYQRGVHHRCYARLVEHVARPSSAIVKAVEEVP